MIPDKLKNIMEKDGVVAIATLGPDGPHMVNTWNSCQQHAADGCQPSRSVPIATPIAVDSRRRC